MEISSVGKCERSMVRVLQPPTGYHSQLETRINASRAKALLFGFLGIAFVGIGFWMLLDQTRPAYTAHPELYTQPWKTIISLVCIIMFGCATFFALYQALTPIPLLLLDSYGLRYQFGPWKRVAIAWHEIKAVVPSKQSLYLGIGSNLRLDIDMSESAALTYPYGRRPHLFLPGLLLDRSFGELLKAVSWYKEVWLIGKNSLRCNAVCS